MTPLNPNVFRLDLPCPHCGETDKQLIGELIEKDEIACRYCREMIDLTNAMFQAGLHKMIEGLQELYKIKP